jgi:hypothetical protein
MKKLTLRSLLNSEFTEAFNRLMDKEMPPHIAKSIAMINSQIARAFEDFTQKRNALLEQHAEDMQIPEDKLDTVNAEIESWLDAELSIDSIPEDIFSHVSSISPKDLIILHILLADTGVPNYANQ